MRPFLNGRRRQGTRGLLAALCVAWVAAIVCGCGPKATEPANKGTVSLATTSSSGTSATPVTFTDIAAQAGIDFRHNNGAAGKKNPPEAVGYGERFPHYENE